MIKHPTPWRLDEFNFILDARGREVMHMPTDDPETRAILLYAAEMWEALNEITSVEPGSPAHRHADKKGYELMRKIEAKIAAARKP